MRKIWPGTWMVMHTLWWTAYVALLFVWLVNDLLNVVGIIVFWSVFVLWTVAWSTHLGQYVEHKTFERDYTRNIVKWRSNG